MSDRKIIVLVIALIVALFALAGYATYARGQERDTAAAPAHEWITKNDNYKRADGFHCCGPEHCKPRVADFAVPIEGGWQIVGTGQVLRWGEKGLYPSEDGVSMWACTNEARVDCLFVPGQGS
jgi:hypothetical protein